MPGRGPAREEILVVDDDDDFRSLLVEHLRSAGRRVRDAASGAEALATLAQDGEAIGLVLLDLWMPRLTGLEVCQQMERSRALQRPVILVTAEHEMRGAGACSLVVGVLHKPVELDRLHALLEIHVACA